MFCIVLQVHMSNQEAHKYLRHNKPGVHLSEIGAPPRDYVRPQGFQVIPGLIGRGGKQPAPGPNQTASYYEALQEEMSRYMYTQVHAVIVLRGLIACGQRLRSLIKH
jgi:hypothetical protein